MNLELKPPPCVVFEDGHLLVVHKPPGWNTHAPAPYAGEGIYDWLRHREPRWADLAIIHRLDKETSGLLVFGKTPLANRSLSEQFAGRTVEKVYTLVTDRAVESENWTVETAIIRNGDHYLARPSGTATERAVTEFKVVRRNRHQTWLEARPITGRTHQIRVHASHCGFPILGDVLYGGLLAPRLCLHAARLAFQHPEEPRRLELEAPTSMFADSADLLRQALASREETDCLRLRHGRSDTVEGIFGDRLGDYLLVQGELDQTDRDQAGLVNHIARASGLKGAYFKLLVRNIREFKPQDACPRHWLGSTAPDRFTVLENNVRYELSFAEGYSVGLFLDQRDNRRRLLVNHVAAGFPLFPGGAAGRELLNCFAYTCAFSVCGALGGMRTTSLDLSRKYLDWGRRNFALNGLDPAGHDFIYGDVFDWLRRLGRKARRFEVIVLDPPTFSRSKTRGDFRAEEDYGKLVAAALPLLARDGILFASTNAARLTPEAFLAQLRQAITACGRSIRQEHYVPQPPDFPITREEPAYLKTVWLRVG